MRKFAFSSSKKTKFYALFTVLICSLMLVIPFVTVRGWNMNKKDDTSTVFNPIPKPQDDGDTTQPVASTDYKSKTILLYRHATGEVQQVNLFDYICGVVAGEMSPTFEKEALKAQTAAAFTYMVYRMEGEKNQPGAIAEHKGAYTCDNPAHCKAYLPKDDAREKWGVNWFNKHWGNIESAVESVLGKVVQYDAKAINAVFFSISSGKTESAKDVWGADVPYLTVKDSPFDQSAGGYASNAVFSEQQFKDKIISLKPDAALGEDPAAWVGEIVPTEAGGVATVTIGGVAVKGTEVRQLFGLRSASFTITYKDAAFEFNVKGYGHGVGMSQNGANELAKEGKMYEEILTYYYNGTVIADYSWPES